MVISLFHYNEIYAWIYKDKNSPAIRKNTRETGHLMKLNFGELEYALKPRVCRMLRFSRSNVTCNKLDEFIQSFTMSRNRNGRRCMTDDTFFETSCCSWNIPQTSTVISFKENFLHSDLVKAPHPSRSFNWQDEALNYEVIVDVTWRSLKHARGWWQRLHGGRAVLLPVWHLCWVCIVHLVIQWGHVVNRVVVDNSCPKTVTQDVGHGAESIPEKQSRKIIRQY